MGIKSPGRLYRLLEKPELIPVGLIYPRTIEKEVVREVKVIEQVEKEVRVEVESHAALQKRLVLEAKLAGLERDFAMARGNFEKAMRDRPTGFNAEVLTVNHFERFIPKSFYYYAGAGSLIAFALGAILL